MGRYIISFNLFIFVLFGSFWYFHDAEARVNEHLMHVYIQNRIDVCNYRIALEWYENEWQKHEYIGSIEILEDLLKAWEEGEFDQNMCND